MNFGSYVIDGQQSQIGNAKQGVNVAEHLNLSQKIIDQQLKIRELEVLNGCLQSQLREQEEKLLRQDRQEDENAHKEQNLKIKELKITQREKELEYKQKIEAVSSNLSQKIKEIEMQATQIEQKNHQIVELKHNLEQINQQLQEKLKQKKMEQMLSEKDEKIKELEQLLKEKEATFGDTFTKLSQTEQKIAKLNLCVKDNQEIIDKLKQEINQRDQNILDLQEAKRDLQKNYKDMQEEKEREEKHQIQKQQGEAQLRLDIENRIKQQEKLSQEYKNRIYAKPEEILFQSQNYQQQMNNQIQGFNRHNNVNFFFQQENQFRTTNSLNAQLMREQIHNNAYQPQNNQIIQHKEYFSPLQNSSAQENHLSQSQQAQQIYQQPQYQLQIQTNQQQQLQQQAEWQRSQAQQQLQQQLENPQQQLPSQQQRQMSGHQNFQMDNNIYKSIQSHLIVNADFYSRLIKEKYLNDNILFFQNPVTVKDILDKEYSGNYQKRNELDQLFRQQNIEWVSIVRGDGNCFFRSFFIEYLLIKMIEFTDAANFSQEIQLFLRAISQIPTHIPAGTDKFFGNQVDINMLIQFSLDYFSRTITQFTQKSAVKSLMESLNNPIFDLAMQILSKSMIIKAVEEIQQNQIQNLYEYIDIEKIRRSVLDFNAENGSSEIYACLATYLMADFLLLNCQNGTQNEYQTYEPLPGILQSPLMFKRNNNSRIRRSGCSQLALWLNTGHYFILYTKDLTERLISIQQNS